MIEGAVAAKSSRDDAANRTQLGWLAGERLIVRRCESGASDAWHRRSRASAWNSQRLARPQARQGPAPRNPKGRVPRRSHGRPAAASRLRDHQRWFSASPRVGGRPPLPRNTAAGSAASADSGGRRLVAAETGAALVGYSLHRPLLSRGRPKCVRSVAPTLRPHLKGFFAGTRPPSSISPNAAPFPHHVDTFLEAACPATSRSPTLTTDFSL